MTRVSRWHVGICVVAVALAALLGSAPGEAHKLISSKYTYNEDVFPILRDRCGRCHVPDGIAPMSLMTYKKRIRGANRCVQSLSRAICRRGTCWTTSARSRTHRRSLHRN